MFCTNTELEIAASSAIKYRNREDRFYAGGDRVWMGVEEKEGKHSRLTAAFYGKLHVYAVIKQGNKSMTVVQKKFCARPRNRRFP